MSSSWLSLFGLNVDNAVTIEESIAMGCALDGKPSKKRFISSGKLACLRIDNLNFSLSSRLFNVPLAILSVESYKGDGNKKDQRGSVIFSRDLAKTTPNIGSKVLLVDDLADSGITLKKSIDWLEHIYGFYLDEPIRTAVIYYKSVSTY